MKLRKIYLVLFFSLYFCVGGIKVNAQYDKIDGYYLPDYENATYIIDENGNIEGTIPLLFSIDGSRNITMSDGSQYRYQYLKGSHCWQYELIIVGGFDTYNGQIVLTKLNTTNPQTKYVFCYGRTDTVVLPYETKNCGYSLNQTGIVYGVNGKNIQFHHCIYQSKFKFFI
ncbi:MAG: hypothetical protein UIM26_06950 [Longicatena sp.]|nr:hypothetical protein [Longicatena sp.]